MNSLASFLNEPGIIEIIRHLYSRDEGATGQELAQKFSMPLEQVQTHLEVLCEHKVVQTESTSRKYKVICDGKVKELV